MSQLENPNPYTEENLRSAAVLSSTDTLDQLMRRVAQYLPGNYRIAGGHHNDANRAVVVIEGHDSAGWTLDDYVIPRLASGLMVAEEIPRD